MPQGVSVQNVPGGISGSRECEIGSGGGLGSRVGMAVRAAGLASPGADAKRLVNDALDGASAAAALGAATKTAIKLLGAARKIVGRLHRVADVVIA
jgi:hypothetical protein